LSDPIYLIGIDLGTTNSVVAYTEAQVDEYDEPQIRVFEIPQLVAPGSVGKREILPSFVLLPGPHDVPDGSLKLPWDQQSCLAVGEFARDRGADLPLRLIASSKSWLCHSGVDRNKAILPWEGPKDSPKLSPVEASAAVLRHIREAWDYVMAREDSRFRMENQEVFLTVPASFDAVARNLTVEAANMAGLPMTTLLEEPQAAFYAWLDATRGKWRDLVKVGDLVLVADIGGGTTDFSLIKVSEQAGELVLERIAVGEHLLVGGDNMDLTLAFSVAERMASKGQKLDTYQMRGLCHGCRSAKEHLFEDEEALAHPVTILGRGSKLIGGTVKTKLTRKEVEEVLMDGFFPECASNVQPRVQLRTGMRELGLSYTSDPAITHHLAHFLRQQESPDGTKGDRLLLPSAVLFNGGVMKARGLRNQFLETLFSWAREADQPTPREIETNDFDLAVAKGAAYYGLARRGKGVRIHGGLARTYYIGIEAAIPAVPGMAPPMKALCVAPFGMEEGTELLLQDKEFGLVVGEPVKFDFLGSNTRHNDMIGMVVEDWEGEIEKITTLETRLWCVSREDARRFKLEFNVRERSGD
jgi:hypothetical protein